MGTFAVEVCYALPERTELLAVEVEPGATVQQAIERSGLLHSHPEVARCGVGIFGRACDRGDLVQPGDRVEIYRPLNVDPKEMRRRAARR